MVRILVCIGAMSFSLSAAAIAAPLDILPEGPSGAPPQRYAQYDVKRAAVPVMRPGPRTVSQSAPAQVYLMRGFMNVFSLGLDDLAAQIEADGIPAAVTNHADAPTVVNQITARYASGDRSPIILIGHSLGADAVIEMAQALDREHIPVALAILFDGTMDHVVPGNVATAVNYTEHFRLTPASDFRGSISNVDLSGDGRIDHLTIDKSSDLHAQTLSYVLAAVSAKQSSLLRRR